MEILNILYSNNLLGVYLIGAILVIIFIIIVISSINTPDEKEKIIKDPIKKEEEEPNTQLETNPRINDLVENIYTKKEEMLEEIPKEILKSTSIIEPIEEESISDAAEEIEEPIVEQDQNANIEGMLNRLYDLRQNEKEDRKRALINEIIDLKKALDEALKSDGCDYELTHFNDNNKALADYYLFNKDMEFPKLR